MPTSVRYEGNPYSIWGRIRKYQMELDAAKRGLLNNYFSPEEIRDIINNVRQACTKLGEQVSTDQLCLVRDLTKKLEELTQIMLGKSSWDKRYGKDEQKEENSAR
jgi:16S rRNA C1402 (ribose-2'-O) methylase RsmI